MLPQILFQICTIDLAVGPLDNATVALTPGQLNMEQDPNMAIFHITHWSLDSKSRRKGSLRMSLTLQRKVTSELMTTYFPSLLLIAITFATTFFKPDFFEAGLSVNLTNMLVMTTIFISKMEGLPPTSDIKMIDIWLILCQLVLFTQVVLLTVMEYLREEPANALEKDARPQPAKDERHAEVGVDVEPKEAWAISQFQCSKASSLGMLTMIGKVLNIFYILQECLFREESDATHRAFCLHCLLFNFCKFLLHIILC